MNFNLSANVRGRFMLEAKNKDTHEITKSTGWFDNLVLDSGLNLMARESWMVGCSVGTGNSEPIATQTQLDALFATTITTSANVTGASSVSPFYGWRRITYRFAAGVFNNTILSEVAVTANSTNKYQIWNRALIRDALGNPTSITLLNDEYLDVTVEVRCYIDENDAAGSFGILDKTGQVVKTIDYVMRPSEINVAGSFNLGGAVAASTSTTSVTINGMTGDIVGNTSKPAGSTRWNGSSTGCYGNYAYVPDSHEIRFRLILGLTQGNYSDISVLYIQTPLGNWQVKLSEPIGKTATQTLNAIARIKWGRA